MNAQTKKKIMMFDGKTADIWKRLDKLSKDIRPLIDGLTLDELESIYPDLESPTLRWQALSRINRVKAAKEKP